VGQRTPRVVLLDTSWYRCPTSDFWCLIRQKNGHVQLQTMEIYLANLHR
jgi:hypothetical protein